MSTTPTVILCDLDSFYVGCETVFNPSLRGRPVVVLSSNDGCVIARSREAKVLGVRMGEPWFQVKDRPECHWVQALSGNFPLYGDLSNRVMRILRDLVPRMEMYSIDEAFADCTGIENPLELVRLAVSRVESWTGLSMSAGIGRTKTRAKLACHYVKTHALPGRVFDIEAMPEAERHAWLASLPVGEVWGVGRRLAPRLEVLGIRSVQDLAESDPLRLHRRFGVVLMRTAMELQGTSCLALEDVVETRRQILCSRSFGSPVYELADLQAAIGTFAARASERLRRQGGEARAVHVFVRTDPFRTDRKQYARGLTVPLDTATADRLAITEAAVAGLKRIFRSGVRYKKAGVMLLDLQPAHAHNFTLLEDAAAHERKERLNAVLDLLNVRYGRDTVRLAVTGLQGQGSWRSRSDRTSPAYTTRWSDLPVAQAGRYDSSKRAVTTT